MEHRSRLSHRHGRLRAPQATPDLCLLQEVDWNAARSGNLDVATELANRLHLNMSYGIEFEELSQEHGQPAYIGQATLSRLPIRRTRVLRFTRQSGFWQPHSWIPSNLPLMQRRLGNRIALVTDLDWTASCSLSITPIWKAAAWGFIQNAQLDEMLADLKTYPADTNVILGGDLNSKYFPSIVLPQAAAVGLSKCAGPEGAANPRHRYGA